MDDLLRQIGMTAEPRINTNPPSRGGRKVAAPLVGIVLFSPICCLLLSFSVRRYDGIFELPVMYWVSVAGTAVCCCCFVFTVDVVMYCEVYVASLSFDVCYFCKWLSFVTFF